MKQLVIFIYIYTVLEPVGRVNSLPQSNLKTNLAAYDSKNSVYYLLIRTGILTGMSQMT